MRLVAVATALLIGSAGAHAQATASAGSPAGNGIVAGQVLNAGSKEYLTNALVQVEGTSLSAVTDRGGDFSLSLPPGNYTLAISYIGLSTERIPVTVSRGEIVTRQIELTSDLYKLEPVVVTGAREGQSKAIQDQRVAMNMKSSVAIDAFGDPGTGVGELLQRLPGISVDIANGGEPSGIYVRGLSQATFGNMMVDGFQLPVTDGQTVAGTYTYLGQVSTNNIESLEVIKAPLPEMDGNAISGYINLRTKRAYDRAPGRLTNLTLGTKWADLNQDASVPGKDKPKLDLITLEYSDVFSVLGGRNNLGVSSTINFNHSAYYVTEAGPSLATGAVQSSFFVPAATPGEPLIKGWGAGHWSNNTAVNYAKTYGLNLDYKLSADTHVYLKSTFSDTSTDSGAYPSYFRWRAYINGTATANSFDPGSTYDYVKIRPTQGVTDVESVLYVRESKSLGLAAGFEQSLFGRTGKLTFDASHNRNKTTYPAINEVKARITGVGFEIDRRGSDEWYPKVTQTAGPDWTNPANYSIVPSQTTGSRIIDFHVPSTNQVLKADLQKNFNRTVPGYFKIGTKLTTARTSSDRRYRYYTWSGQNGMAATGGITPFVAHTIKMGEGNYGPFPFLQVPTSGLTNDLWNNPANWTQTPAQVWQTVLDTEGSGADVKRIIAAGYAQTQVKLEQLRMLAGVRYEETDNRGAGPVRRIVSTGPEANTQAPTLSAEENARRARANWPEWRTQSSQYGNVFPGIHFVYDFKSGLQARLSYNISIVRPSLTELTPRINYTENVNNPGILTKGNPDLKPYTSDNFEAAVQYYFEPIGMFSAGVFLKEISNYFRSFDRLIGSGPDNGFGGDYAGYTLRQNENVGDARVRGIELAYSQQFTFLPGLLKGFGAYANLTLLQTEGDFGTTTVTKRLPRLTPRTWNAGLTWRGRGFDVRLLANYRGPTFTSTANGTFGTVANGGLQGTYAYDLYEEERLLLDLKAQYTINRQFSVYFNIFNLTNEWSFERSVNGFGRERMIHQAQHNGVNFTAGVKTRF